jgi:hypothetical protein
MRFEYVWSLAVALIILSGAIAWTAASARDLNSTIARPADPAETLRTRPGCRKYAQYEFKVGYIVSPSCLPQ